jgi:hypothetical protein
MRAVTVYRVDYTRKTKDPIGTYTLHIVIDVRHAREAILPERTMDCAAG